MKVKIGPYLQWWGAYQICDQFQKIGVSEDTTYKMGQWLSETWVQTVCEWIYSKRKRTVKIHIDHYDVWSMDSTLSPIILPMLKRLKEVKHGSPCVDDGDAPWYLNSKINSSDDEADPTDLAIHKRWAWVLDEMIWTFEQLTEEDWEARYSKETKELREPDDFMADVFKYKTQYDWDGMKKHNAAIDNGLRLFGKYFRALWD